MSVENDLEFQVFRITDRIESEINNQIAAVNAEKSATDVSELGLPAPIVIEDVNAFYWNMNVDQIPTKTPYVTYRWLSQPDGQAGPHTSEQIKIVVALIASDQMSTDSAKITRRFMRYRKALRKTLEGTERSFNLQGFRLTPVPDDIIPMAEGRNYWAIPMILEFSFA